MKHHTKDFTESGLVFSDISSETEREYGFPNGERLLIGKPLYLHVSDSGGHRLYTEDNWCYYVQPKDGWWVKWKATIKRPFLLDEETIEKTMVKNNMSETKQSTKFNNEWSATAYSFLLSYMIDKTSFMIEDVRNASAGFIAEPLSKRAWGGIAVRAARAGIIKGMGHENVKNPKAHKTPATIWKVI